MNRGSVNLICLGRQKTQDQPCIEVQNYQLNLVNSMYFFFLISILTYEYYIELETKHNRKLDLLELFYNLLIELVVYFRTTMCYNNADVFIVQSLTIHYRMIVNFKYFKGNLRAFYAVTIIM